MNINRLGDEEMNEEKRIVSSQKTISAPYKNYSSKTNIENSKKYRADAI